MTQTEQKHTPAPWQDNGSGLIFGQASGDDGEAPFVADVCRDGAGGFYSDQEQANARLIAAAPELLEVVRVVLSTAREEALLPIECDMMREAIAKATGGVA